MKIKLFSILGSLLFTLAQIGGTVSAATPDGQTPSEEGIFDGLTADGVPKGMFGLCVAFCEAPDFVEMASPC